MTLFFTLLFLICSFVVLIPVTLVAWDMFMSRGVDGSDTAEMARILLCVSVANLLFHASQFTTVLLGALGISMEARVPIILLIDGSLVVLTLTYIYAYFSIRAIRKHI